MAAAHRRFRIRLGQRAAAADPHQILGADFERRVEHVVLLLDHAGTVPGDHEHALNAGERLFQRRAVSQFRDHGFGIPAQHFARFVRIANNTNRILSERPKLFHHHASGIARCSDYRNRHRRFLPTVLTSSDKTLACARDAITTQQGGSAPLGRRVTGFRAIPLKDAFNAQAIKLSLAVG